MKESIKVGFNFGTTSAIITTLGLIIGLNTATSSRLAVIGGIITIAIADACSDALGIHISEEGENKHTKKEIWESTFSTFFFKFVFAAMFIVPFLLVGMKMAIGLSIFFGLVLLSLFSFELAKKQKKESPLKIVFEHLIIAIFVMVITYLVGLFVGKFFI